jgi:signal transduction histidine kinase/FixJ family two-component response regulator
MNVGNGLDDMAVLVVDDEQDIRDGSERILSRMGYRVFKASRGDEGLSLLAKEKVQIVLLDLKMPGMDGMEVLKQIQAIDASIQVIVITGYATVETAITAMKHGAYDFIPKPFEPDQLRIVVNRASEKLRLIREAQKLEKERLRTLSDLDAEKSRIRTILEFLPNGVMVTNSRSQVVLMNPAFMQYLDLSPDRRPGEPVENYLPDPSLCQLVKEISQGRHVDYDDIPSLEFPLPSGKYLLARAQPVLGERRECLGAVLNVVDITTMKLLDRLKSEFVAKVSHELRSPLSTIHEQLAYVLNDMIGNADKGAPAADQQILARAKEKTKGLISMIGDLLDLSRIEEGILCREPAAVQPTEILKNVVEFLKSQAQAKNQLLELKLPDQPLPILTADPLALESIFGNLITNAINYTQQGGYIRVIAEPAGLNVRISVSDNGFGIEAQHLDKIFERFYRVKNEKTRFITGTGLGLPIVKGLVDSLGGLILVDSTPGEGTTFTVLLPIRKPLDR